MSIFDREHSRYGKQPDNHWLKKADHRGFPQDDANSLMQGDYGCANLDIFYSSQFVQNETQSSQGKEELTYYPLEYTPILEGTMTGTIYLGTKAVQTFSVSSSGKFDLGLIEQPSVFVKHAELNHVTGELKLWWNKAPGHNSVVVSYEYNMESNFGQ